MIDGAFAQLPGIGSRTIETLHQQGIGSWRQLREQLPTLTRSAQKQQAICDAIQRCECARDEDDVAFLVKAFLNTDHWRILGTYFEEASWFDIETSGMGPGSYITLIMCYHQGHLLQFTRGENLDDFLDLLEEIRLLVSFNGASFDVPRVEDAFHIPAIPCPHIDLRWLCYHEALRGGLKSIEKELAIDRPPDLIGVDGEEAIWLWEDWAQDGNEQARRKLERYCGADVIALKMVAARLLQMKNPDFQYTFERTVWDVLDEAVSTRVVDAPVVNTESPNGLEDTDRLQRRWAKMKRLKQKRTSQGWP